MAKTFLDLLHGESTRFVLIEIELSLSLQPFIKYYALIGGTFRFFGEAKGRPNLLKGFVVGIFEVFVANKNIMFHKCGHFIKKIPRLNFPQLKNVLVGLSSLHVPIPSNLWTPWFVPIRMDGLVEKSTW